MLLFINKLWLFKILRYFSLVIIPIFLISCDNKGSSNLSENNTNSSNVLNEIGIDLPTECE
ncbi:hypothetical protein GCL60_11215 [Silvanigrella paludirubra]|uniref:Uncharacterized protein n=1 Tax=Silvanigrella paludirubra TaxID=2499159 RepID=A0A6N6VV74_9BACT|nr:hypothetical protein [Silvanigrella paludirubra]KAB8037735.1 hypothetical protein GCL60_11215 [Silvanigrella paludirubra]